jgi:hypothetical protein
VSLAPNPMGVLDRVRREVQHSAERGRNGTRCWQVTGHQARVRPPKEVVWRPGRSTLGFTGRALLRDHIRARNRELHDLVVLAHFADAA